MLYDLFLIKKLLKSVICGTVNSAWMHCSQLTKSTLAAEPKKEREKNAVIKRRRRNNCNPNSHITFMEFLFFFFEDLGCICLEVK